MISKWDGIYDYKGFSIWSPGEDGKWIAEPNFESDLASDNYRSRCSSFRTISIAKKWVKDFGHTIKEVNYLK